MRRAVLTFGFVGLAGRRAETGAWTDNGPSIGVTTRLGYEPDGSAVKLRRGAAAEQRCFRMTAEAFAARPELTDGIAMAGVTPDVRAALGAETDPGSDG